MAGRRRARVSTIGDVVQELTRGRPYAFVIMPYKKKWEFYEHLRGVVQDSVGLRCIRADEIPGSGYDLLTKIHLLIERAEVVIAEISTDSPNVFYEVGYAVAEQKSLLLLVESGIEVPTDLKGLEQIEHGGGREAMAVFDHRLSEHLRLRTNSRISILRDMLEADRPMPAFIVTHPKYPDPDTPDQSGVYDYRTYGDNLGILGLIAAFGAISGEGSGVELISAQFAPPDLFEQDVNLYFIGSEKVNPPSGEALKRLQNRRRLRWEVGPAPGEEGTKDYKSALFRTRHGEKEVLQGRSRTVTGRRGAVHLSDYGIIIRGPHPEHPGRIIMVMAGPHSLGTGAACLAATRSPLIQQIRDALPDGVDLADKDRTIWALVRAEANRKDYLLDLEGVTVVEAGAYR